MLNWWCITWPVGFIRLMYNIIKLILRADNYRGDIWSTYSGTLLVRIPNYPDQVLSGSPIIPITNCPYQQLSGSPIIRNTNYPDRHLSGSTIIPITIYPDHQLSGSPIIRITNYPDHQLTGSAWNCGKICRALTCLEITGYRINYNTVSWFVDPQTGRGRTFQMRLRTVINNSSRNSNCHCKLFSDKNPIIRVFDYPLSSP